MPNTLSLSRKVAALAGGLGIALRNGWGGVSVRVGRWFLRR